MSSYLNRNVMALRDSRYGPTERLILLFVDAYSRHGVCRLPNAHIAACCGVHEKTAARVIRSLVRDQLLVSTATTQVGRTLRTLKLAPALRGSSDQEPDLLGGVDV